MNTQIIRPPTPIKSGIMMIWPTDTAPSGWLLCFGQAISRAGNSGLFAAIGTVFGVGDGSTTFNLPDYRGRVPLGKDNMGGASANRVTSAQADAIGGAEGAENNSLTEAQMPAHVHTGPDHLHTGPDHLHTITNHVHTGPSHTHAGPSHVHTGPAHTHGITANDEIGLATDIFVRSVSGGESTDHTQSDGTGNTGAGGTGDTGSAGAGNTGSNGTGNTGSSGTGNTGSAGAGNTGSNGTGNTGSSGTGNTGSKGSGGAHNNMSPYLTLNYIIKI